MALYSFASAIIITSAFALISYFYIQESTAMLKIQEKYKIEHYANKITKYNRTLKEFKESIFGTLESFLYRIAIIDTNGKILYTTFTNTPKYEPHQLVYMRGDSVFYNNTKTFLPSGPARIILKKDLDYSDINNRIFILAISVVTFLILCSIFLYLHTTKVHNIMNRNLDFFLKDAIHEIRTPLGVIQINLEFLENTVKSSMPLKRAQGGLRNLTSVYESIEYFIKNAKTSYPKAWVSVAPLLKSRIDFFRILAEIKNLEIKSDIADNLFLHINVVELQRLIDNNLSNAIKYSKKGTTIKITLIKDAAMGMLCFSSWGEQIHDTKKIFRRYYRGDNILGGFGLGLSMVEHICNIYKINIDVISTQEGHTRFSYYLPSKILKEGNS